MEVTRAYDYSVDLETKAEAVVSCLRCSKELSNKQTLRRHCRDVHGVNLDLMPIKVETFPCPESSCTSKGFKRRSQLYAHIKAVHNGKSRGQRTGLIHESKASQSTVQKQQLLYSVSPGPKVRGDPPPQHSFFDAAAQFPDINDAKQVPDLMDAFQTQEQAGEYGLDPAAFDFLKANPTEPQIIDASEFQLYPDCVFRRQTNTHGIAGNECGKLDPASNYRSVVGNMRTDFSLEPPMLPYGTFSGVSDGYLPDIDDSFPALGEYGAADEARDSDDQAKRKMLFAIGEKYMELSRLDEKIRKLEELKVKRSEISGHIAGLEVKLQGLLPCM